MPPTAGSSTVEAPHPRFFFDFASPECWLVAERVLQTIDGPCEWVPVHVEPPAFRCAAEG